MDLKIFILNLNKKIAHKNGLELEINYQLQNHVQIALALDFAVVKKTIFFSSCSSDYLALLCCLYFFVKRHKNYASINSERKSEKIFKWWRIEQKFIVYWPTIFPPNDINIDSAKKRQKNKQTSNIKFNNEYASDDDVERKEALNSVLETDNKGVLGDVTECNISSCFALKKKITSCMACDMYELQHIMKAEVQKAKTERARKMSSCVCTLLLCCRKNLLECFLFEAARLLSK